MISCYCDLDNYDEGIQAVGSPREVICRTPRKCDACGAWIEYGKHMWMWSRYDFDEYHPVGALDWCEECGDLAGALMDLGFCFDPVEGIKAQWFEYLYDQGPADNPVTKRLLMEYEEKKS